MKSSNWMPLYVADYLADTGRLTTEMHGAYMLLIMEYWHSESPLPDDDEQLSAIARMPLQKWQKIRPSIGRFFSMCNSTWIHKRIDGELAHAKQVMAKRQSASKSRWHPESPPDADTYVPSTKESKKEPPAPRGAAPPEERSVGKRSKPKERISPDRQPTAEDRAFAGSHGISADAEWPQFVDYHLREGSLLADVAAAWRTWVRNAVKFAGRSGGGGRGRLQRGPSSIAEATADVIAAAARASESVRWPGDGGNGGGPVPQPHGQPPTRSDGPSADDWGFIGGADGVPAGHCANGAPQVGEVIEVVADPGGDPGGVPVASGTPQGNAQGDEVRDERDA